MTSRGSNLAPSPVTLAFPHIQWDPLGSLRLTAQETALLRMAETNPMEYTLADSRDASMYARVLLKLLAETSAAGSGSGQVSQISDSILEEEALNTLDEDPLGVVTHYAITKLLDMLTMLTHGNNVTISSVFYVGKEGLLVDQWKALLRILHNRNVDLFAQSGAALCLAQILFIACPSQQTATSSSHPPTNDSHPPSKKISFGSAVEPMEALISWIISQLKPSTGNLTLAIPALTAFMNATEARVCFAKRGGIKYLSRQLKMGGKKSSSSSSSSSNDRYASVQQLYELTFCLWTMTYELNSSEDIRNDFSKDNAAVAALVELVSSAPREKVVRVALSALVNLAVCVGTHDSASKSVMEMDGASFLSEMIACGLMKAIDLLLERQWTDPDMVQDMQTLHKLLVENYKEMSRWEVYKSEVESGHLRWGSVHTEKFFKENASLMEGKDGQFRILKVLIALLSSTDDDVSAIACYDIGEFVRHYPNGRSIAKRLGAKETVMALIDHENVDVQRHALQCVSKIMVQNWAFVK